MKSYLFLLLLALFANSLLGQVKTNNIKLSDDRVHYQLLYPSDENVADTLYFIYQDSLNNENWHVFKGDNEILSYQLADSTYKATQYYLVVP